MLKFSEVSELNHPVALNAVSWLLERSSEVSLLSQPPIKVASFPFERLNDGRDTLLLINSVTKLLSHVLTKEVN